MKAFIFNSGMGNRMGNLTEKCPKCMMVIDGNDTVLSRQLRILEQAGIREAVITTGYLAEELMRYCKTLKTTMKIHFCYNPVFQSTNYIYSIYLARSFVEDDVLIMHGDMVFEENLIRELLQSKSSVMTVSTTSELPEKDFKAVVDHDRIRKIGVEYFENSVAAQPIYKLNRNDWVNWLDEINKFCHSGNTSCYAENAFNDISQKINLYAFDVRDRLCMEIDTPDDLAKIKHDITRKP